MNSSDKRRNGGFLGGLAYAAAATLAFGGLAVAPAIAAPSPAQAAEACTPVEEVNTVGDLQWAFRDSWNRYLAMPFAGWVVTPHGGATRAADGVITYKQDKAASTFDANTGKGIIAFTGGARYTGHHGAADVVIQNPQITVNGDGTGVLTLETSETGTSAFTVVRRAFVNLTGVTAENTDNFTNFKNVKGIFTQEAGPDALAGYSGQPAADLNFSAGKTVAAVTCPAAELPAPTVSVSPADLTNLNPNGAEVTITGTGFLPNDPATTGGRPPLAGKFTGAYLAFGQYADTWKPSEGAPASARVNDRNALKWLLPEESHPMVGGVASGAHTLNPDGTFSATLTLKEGALAEGKHWGIVTYPGGGASYPAFETFTPVSFAAPTLAVEPAAAKAGDSVVVKGQFFKAGEEAVLKLGDKTLGTAVADATGNTTFNVALPEDAAAGAQTLTAAQASAAKSATATVNVTAKAAPEPAPAPETDPATETDPAQGADPAGDTDPAQGTDPAEGTVPAPETDPAGETDPAPVAPAAALNKQAGKAGESFIVTGSNFAPNAEVAFEFHSDPVQLGTVITDAAGAFSFTAAVPANATAGAHNVRVLQGDTAVDLPFTVFVPITPSTSADVLAAVNANSGAAVQAKKVLAKTGAEAPLLLAGIGLAAVLTGAAALRSRRNA
ncbi:HtaA domain-containing protein [Canibacter zhoujuaniae]|uniref:HtaA domain-containing protein n=1 Tax=Canibacter zhoujuaniae TaxID=2708343 RepID=UPI00141E1C64|nr:HtaA domain-containing protein [Canibacter zhoujuaniae]